MLRSDGEQGFLLFPRAPSRGRLAVDVYVCCKHRYKGKLESVIRILEEDFYIPVLNVYYSQEGFSRGRGSDVADQYSAKVEEYKRTDTAALDRLYTRRLLC